MVLRVREHAKCEERLLGRVDAVRLVGPWSVDRGAGGERQEGLGVAGEVGAEGFYRGALELGWVRYHEGEKGEECCFERERAENGHLGGRGEGLPVPSDGFGRKRPHGPIRERLTKRINGPSPQYLYIEPAIAKCIKQVKEKIEFSSMLR